MPESRYYFVEDVMAMMEVRETKAYEIIKALNDELKDMGKVIIPGRVPKTYFHHRTDVEITESVSRGKPVRVAI